MALEYNDRITNKLIMLFHSPVLITLLFSFITLIFVIAIIITIAIISIVIVIVIITFSSTLNKHSNALMYSFFSHFLLGFFDVLVFVFLLV